MTGKISWFPRIVFTHTLFSSGKHYKLYIEFIIVYPNYPCHLYVTECNRKCSYAAAVCQVSLVEPCLVFQRNAFYNQQTQGQIKPAWYAAETYQKRYLLYLNSPINLAMLCSRSPCCAQCRYIAWFQDNKKKTASDWVVSNSGMV